jgi:hypothetical protein
MTCIVPSSGCDIQAALLSPGNISLRPVGGARDEWFPGAEELLAIDAMAGPNYPLLKFDRAAVELRLIAPAGATFVVPSDQAPFLPFASYEMMVAPNPDWVPFTVDSLIVMVTRWQPLGQQTELNQGNSTSFYLGLKGRGNAAINVQAAVVATGNVLATARSCDWEIRGLTLGDSLGGLLHRHPPCP